MPHDLRECKSQHRLVLLTRVLVLAGVALLTLFGARLAFAQDEWYVDDSQDDGLVAHWRMDETFGTTTRDFVGTAHGTASASGGLVISPVAVVGLPNNGAFSAAATRFITVTNSSALNLATSFTVSAWVRRDSVNTFHAIYDSGQPANQQDWWFFISGDPSGTTNDNRLGFGERAVQEVYGTTPITADGQYHHVAIVKNGDSGANLSFYLDGVLDGTASVGAVTTPAGVKHIGALFNPALIASTRFNGMIDDLRVYNRALTGLEIARLADGYGCVTDGGSWAQAFRELQCALNTNVSLPGDDVLIAKGLYYPGTNPFANFNVANDLHLYGGYNNGDPSFPRPVSDFAALPAELTILSSDLDRNDSLTLPAFATYAGNSRRVVHLSAGNTTHLQNLQIRGGNATSTGGFSTGGGMSAFAGSSATLQNVSFLANRAEGNGGAVFAEGALQITSGQFISNTSISNAGGAIHTTAPLTVTAGLFKLNHASSFGGAISTFAPATISDTDFFTNTATAFDGGAIQARSTLHLTRTDFRFNTAGFSGGAVALEFGSAGGTVIDSTFFFNRATTFHGGAIAATFVSLTVADSVFENNRASSSGGAITNLKSVTQTLTIDNTRFASNSVRGINCTPLCSSADGGALAISGTSVIRNSQFMENRVLGKGGALFATVTSADGNSTTVIDSTFDGNLAGDPVNPASPNLGSGGAIWSSIPLSVTDTLVQSNGAEEGGGILTSQGGRLHVQGSRFVDNTSNFGGGMKVQADTTVVDTLFSGNSSVSSLGGAAIFAQSTFTDTGFTVDIELSLFLSHLEGAVLFSGLLSAPTLLQGSVVNSIFMSNLSPDPAMPADIFNEDAQVAILHNTFLRGDGDDYPAIGASGNTTVRNNIFAFDSPSPVRAAILAATNGVANESHNLFFNANLNPGSGTINSQGGTVTGNPLFVDPVSDFRLSLASPARNAGTNAGVTRDFEGDVRPIGPAPDIGYDEARFVAPLVVPPANDVATVNQAKTFGLGSFTDGDGDGPFPISVNWGDGSPNTSFVAAAQGAIAPQSHTYATIGAKSVTITVSDAAGQAHSVSFVVTVSSPGGTGTPGPNPTSGGPATPTPTLQPNVQFLPAITKP